MLQQKHNLKQPRIFLQQAQTSKQLERGDRMKTKINGYEVEGTVEEIMALVGMAKTVKKEIEHKPVNNWLPPKKKQNTTYTTYNKKNKPWSKADDTVLEQLWKANKKNIGLKSGRIKIIAAALGRTEQSCQQRHHVVNRQTTPHSYMSRTRPKKILTREQEMLALANKSRRDSFPMIEGIDEEKITILKNVLSHTIMTRGRINFLTANSTLGIDDAHGWRTLALNISKQFPSIAKYFNAPNKFTLSSNGVYEIFYGG